MLHLEKPVITLISPTKPSIVGLKMEKSLSSKLKEVINVSSSTIPTIQKKISFMPELVAENKKTISHDKLTSSSNNLMTPKSSPILVADLITIEKVFNLSLDKLSKEISTTFTYPIPIVSHESHLISSNGSLNILEQNLLQFPLHKPLIVPMNKNLLTTSLESLRTIPRNIMENENISNLSSPKPRYQSLKIRIFPSHDQKIYLSDCLNLYRLVYNYAIDCISTLKKTNFIFIRNKVFEKINENYNNPLWFNNLYFDSKTLAIKEACEAFKSNYAKGQIFNIKFKNRLSKRQNLKIDHRVPKIKDDKLYIFNNKLKDDIFVRKRDITKLNDIFSSYELSDSEIIRDYPGKYYLIINYKTMTQNKVKIQKKVSIDPGLKTLYTCYTKEGTYMKLGNNIQETYKKYTDRINKLNEIISTKRGRTKRNMRKRLFKLRAKIKNIVDNHHNNISSFIASTTEEIIIPKLDVKNMINKAKRNINKNVVKDIIYKSPYKLHQKMIDQCEKYNTKIIIADERGTTIRCGCCGNIKEKSERTASRIYECKKCGMKIDRDYNASRNIMLKSDEKL